MSVFRINWHLLASRPIRQDATLSFDIVTNVHITNIEKHHLKLTMVYSKEQQSNSSIGNFSQSDIQQFVVVVLRNFMCFFVEASQQKNYSILCFKVHD